MATKTIATQNEVITSLKDGAYKQARAGDTVKSVARYCLSNVVGFPEDIPKDALEQLNEGYRLRFSENNPPKQYAVIDDKYLLVNDSNNLKEASNKKLIGVDFAFSFNQQVFGKLKETEPYMYPIVKQIRKEVQTYCSNRINDLKREARRIQNEGKENARTAVKDFTEVVDAVFNDGKTGLIARCGSAKKRDDVTADLDKLKQSIKAFNLVWLK